MTKYEEFMNKCNELASKKVNTRQDLDDFNETLSELLDQDIALYDDKDITDDQHNARDTFINRLLAMAKEYNDEINVNINVNGKKKNLPKKIMDRLRKLPGNLSKKIGSLKKELKDLIKRAKKDEANKKNDSKKSKSGIKERLQDKAGALKKAANRKVNNLKETGRKIKKLGKLAPKPFAKKTKDMSNADLKGLAETFKNAEELLLGASVQAKALKDICKKIAPLLDPKNIEKASKKYNDLIKVAKTDFTHLLTNISTTIGDMAGNKLTYINNYFRFDPKDKLQELANSINFLVENSK